MCKQWLLVIYTLKVKWLFDKIDFTLTKMNFRKLILYSFVLNCERFRYQNSSINGNIDLSNFNGLIFSLVNLNWYNFVSLVLFIDNQFIGSQAICIHQINNRHCFLTYTFLSISNSSFNHSLELWTDFLKRRLNFNVFMG